MMKRIFPVLSALFFAACASAPQAVEKPSPRYATPEETARLQKEARANFERERQQQGILATVGSGPTQTSFETRRDAPLQSPRPTAARRIWSMAEARYAMQIGKAPSELTDGERAVARSY